jgi:hypothetical protein
MYNPDEGFFWAAPSYFLGFMTQEEDCPNTRSYASPEARIDGILDAAYTE